MRDMTSFCKRRRHKRKAMESFNRSTIDSLIKRYQAGKSSLITILQDIQGERGYLPKDALAYFSAAAGVPLSKIHCVATFYRSFSLEPRGKNIVSVCLGTACHVKDGENILLKMGRELKLASNEGTTPDRKFTLEKVRCLGCCSMAPVVRVNKDTYGNVHQSTVPKILAPYRKAEKK
jgi:NADH-quinone oxidoreductase subunit E